MKNLSSPFVRASDLRVNRLILADIACPCFRASLTLALYSRGKDGVLAEEFEYVAANKIMAAVIGNA